MTKNVDSLTDFLVFEDYSPVSSHPSSISRDDSSSASHQLVKEEIGKNPHLSFPSSSPSESLTPSLYYYSNDHKSRRGGSDLSIGGLPGSKYYRDFISVGYDKVSNWVQNYM